MLELMTGSILKKISEPGLEIDPEVFQKLLASDGATSDRFGFLVAVSNDGSTIVIGAYLDDDRGADSGSVYIFNKQANGSYLQTQKLLASDGATDDSFGYSVSISGDGSTIVVGIPYDDDQGGNSGSVCIFTKQTDGSYLETQKLVAVDGASSDHFGWSVVISNDGSTVVVGSRWDDDKGRDSGSVYVFTKQLEGNYLQVQKLLASDGATNDYFGASAAISGDGSTIIVGAYRGDDKGTDSGSAYVFIKQANGSYLQTQKLVAVDGASNDNFGFRVAVSRDGSTAVVSAYRDDDKGTDSGSAYVFTKQVNGSYLQTQKLVASDGAADDNFGISVVISADDSTVVVGAYRDSDKGGYAGSAYIFTQQANDSYLQIQKLVAADGADGAYFGYSVAISQTSVVVGAYNHLSKGAVYVF